VVVRAVNRAENKRRKKKDNRKKKAQRKARVQLDRGKRRQESEEEEDEGAYGSGSPIPWEDLAGEDGPVCGDASPQAMGPFPYHVGEDTPSKPMETDVAS
jgi:hypothetical protein